MTTEERLIEKFHLEDCDVVRLSPDFDGYEVYMATPKGTTEETLLYVGVPMVFLVKGEEMTAADSDMALIMMGLFTPQKEFEKSLRNFVPDESDKEFKRRFQAASPEERKGWGYDLVDTDDPEGDALYCKQANKWLRDGQPVD